MRRLSENIRIAFQSLILNKTRSILTMLGIIIGVGAVVAMLSLGMGARESIMDPLEGLGSNLIYIIPGNAQEQNTLSINKAELTIDDYKALEKHGEYISEITPVISSSSTVSYLNKNIVTSVSAVSETGKDIFNVDISRGNFFRKSDVDNNSNVAVIGDTVRETLFGKMDPIGKIIKIDGKNLKVIGVTEPLGAMMGVDQDNGIYIPITTAQNKIYGTDSYSMILLRSTDGEDNAAVTEKITDILRRSRQISDGEKDDFTIQSQSQILEIVNVATGVFTVVIAGIASISLLVGGIGIMNIMLVSVTERTREIGIRKAIGAKNRDILVQFLIESLVLSVTGGIIGILFAYLISVIISGFTVLDVGISPLSVLIATSFSMVIGLFFGIFPAMRAARLNPIDALRHE